MKVTIVPIGIGALGTITKGLLKGLEDLEVGGRTETIQATALLRTAGILRLVLETCWNLLSLKLQWKSSVNTDVKNSKGVNIEGIELPNQEKPRTPGEKETYKYLEADTIK